MTDIISGIDETMADTDKDTANEIAVEKVEIRSDAEILASNQRIEKMDLLSKKLAVKKSGMTKEIKKKLKQAIIAFQKEGTEGATASILKVKVKEVVKPFERLKEFEKELQSISEALTEVMCESKAHELKGSTPEVAMSKIDEDVEVYVKRYKKAFEDNENIISDAM